MRFRPTKRELLRSIAVAAADRQAHGEFVRDGAWTTASYHKWCHDCGLSIELGDTIVSAQRPLDELPPERTWVHGTCPALWPYIAQATDTRSDPDVIADVVHDCQRQRCARCQEWQEGEVLLLVRAALPVTHPDYHAEWVCVECARRR